MAEDYPSIMPLPILSSIDTKVNILINNTILFWLFIATNRQILQILIQYIKNMGCYCKKRVYQLKFGTLFPLSLLFIMYN